MRQPEKFMATWENKILNLIENTEHHVFYNEIFIYSTIWIMFRLYVHQHYAIWYICDHSTVHITFAIAFFPLESSIRNEKCLKIELNLMKLLNYCTLRIEKWNRWIVNIGHKIQQNGWFIYFPNSWNKKTQNRKKQKNNRLRRHHHRHKMLHGCILIINVWEDVIL